MYKGPIIDVDVHHTWGSEKEVLEYVREPWKELVVSPGGGRTLLSPALANHPFEDGANKRLDSYPADGSRPGSDYDMMREQLLDPLGIEYAVLSFDIGEQSGVVNPYLAVELCRAANEWTVDRWLGIPDERLVASLVVPTEMPDEAARDIRRHADNPRVVEVLLMAPAMGKPFGHPVYDPIHAAAEECGLALGVHLGGHLFGKGLQAAGGMPHTRLEQFVTNNQPGMHHATSLITHGVFEKFPNLKVVLKENGFSWIPWLLAKLDASYDLIRRENPLVRRLPSEYFREHVVASTQPFDHTPKAQQMVDVLETFDGIEDVLVFSSDYPHWDADDATHVAARLPHEWHEKLFFENAARMYNLPNVGRIRREHTAVPA